MKTEPFTRSVIVPKRDDATREIIRDADGKPIDSDVTLGEFTFKRPTLREEVLISTRFAQMTHNQPLDAMPARAADIAVMLSELPIVVTKAPKDWAWDDLQGDEDFYRVVAVWNAYQEGRTETTGAKPATETREPASSTTAAR
jgi:hypothetical protein